MEDHHRERILNNVDKLVSGTNSEAFEKMLDIFFQERFLSRYMIDKIMRGATFEEKKTLFYKMIPKRGPKAFKQLVGTLISVGLIELSLILKENSLLMYPPSYAENGEEPNDIYSLRNENLSQVDGNWCFRRSDMSGEANESNEEVYLVNSKPKGYVLLVNISEFQGFPDDKRNGSKNDVKRIKEVFEKRGFEVIIRENLKKKEFEETILNFAKMEELKKVDSAFIFIMTHGTSIERRQLFLQMHDSLGSNLNSHVQADWITEQFNAINCKYLVGKPKIFFFQSCRGNNKDLGVGIETDSATNGLLKKKVPQLSDQMVVYSTLPGCVAERDPKKGSFFIQTFCDILSKDRKLREIIDVLNEVDRILRKKFKGSEVNSFQGVEFDCLSFSKKLYI